MPGFDYILMAFIRFIYLLLIFYCCINERKEVAAIPSLLVLCNWQSEAWLAVVTALAIYAQTDDPGCSSSSNSISNSCSCSCSGSTQQPQTGKEGTTTAKKGTDIAASAQQSCRSIHQKMETNFLSVVVSPVDVIVVLAAVAHNTLRLLLLAHFFCIFVFFILPFLFYCCSIFYLAFY